MPNELHNNTDITAHDGIAFPVDAVGTGNVSGLEFESVGTVVADVVPLWEQIQFWYSEYFKGILFVLASTVFILAVPAMLTNRDRVKTMVFRITKRIIDIVGALVGIVLTLPVFILLPIIIKLDSRGSVFYSQVRVGENRRQRGRRYCQRTDVNSDRRSRDRRRENSFGRTFKVLKFRTMVSDAEKGSGPVWATKNDPRITRLGAFLRKSRLDEIPQFINVLMGDMSLVGPRPERPKFVKELRNKIKKYDRRLEVKPGLTGLAQVEAGYDTSVESVVNKVNHDIEYIDNWSLWLDFKILCKTVVVVLTGRGAC